MKIPDPGPRQRGAKSLLQDDRFRSFAVQFAVLALIVLLLGQAGGNALKALAARGMEPSFSFLKLSSGIVVGEKLIEFESSSSNLRALMVGLLNTISISVLVIAFSLVLGLFVVVCRISTNWLVSAIAKAYIEVIRNVPLLLLLLVWYRAFFLQMPGIRQAIMLGKTVDAEGITRASLILSNRGLFVSWPLPTEAFATYRYALLGAAIVAIGLYAALKIRSRRTGKSALCLLWSILAFLALSGAGFLAMGGDRPFRIDVPQLGRFNAKGGLYVSSEWFSLFSGLVLYTSAFVAEAFRAGIQGVPKGQMEAARSLGFGHLRSLRLVVIPQAKIVVIPPLTSIFLGVAKNTSLGVAIGFPDLFSITGTIINQTGRALEMILIVMAIYLAMSLATSLFMNWYNKRVQLVER